MDAHGGRLAVEVLRAHGVDVIFTLSGGHLFVLYDGAVQADLRLVDTRHEQTATFAAEGWAKVTRRLGCAALTAGPGVTNGISAMTAAGMNGTPMVVIGGRAPERRWGSGSLQELDHVPIVAPVVKRAATAVDADAIVRELHASCVAARTPHRGPTFVDVPLDGFGPGSVDLPDLDDVNAPGSGVVPDNIKTVGALIASAQQPVVLAGGDVYWGHAEEQLVAFAEAAGVPVFVNGMVGARFPPITALLSRARARSR